MRLLTKWTVLIFFCAFVTLLQAKEATTRTVYYSIPESAKEITSAYEIPLAFSPTEYFVVQVMINGKGPFLFMVDTGSSYTMLSKTVAQALNLPLQRRIKYPNNNSYSSLEVYQIDQLKLGEAEVNNYQVNVYSEPSIVTHFRNQKNIPIDGILGIGAFYHYLVTFDYQARKIILQSKALEEGEGVMEFEDTRRSPVIPILFKDKNNVTLYIKCLIDTGFSGYFALPASVKTIPFKVLKEDKTLVRAGFEEHVINKDKLDVSVYVGKKKIVSPTVLYGKDIYGKANEGFGLLGLLVIHQFKVSIDQKSRLIKIE